MTVYNTDQRLMLTLNTRVLTIILINILILTLFIDLFCMLGEITDNSYKWGDGANTREMILTCLFEVITVAARGCLPPGANVFVAAPTPTIRSSIDILMVTTMALVWTVNSTLSWRCNYAMQWKLG